MVGQGIEEMSSISPVSLGLLEGLLLVSFPSLQVQFSPSRELYNGLAWLISLIFTAPYCASKAAVISMTQCDAIDVSDDTFFPLEDQSLS